MLFLPQKPYLTDGTLREQIDFPLAVDPHLATDERTQQILDVSAAFFYLVFFTGFRPLAFECSLVSSLSIFQPD